MTRVWHPAYYQDEEEDPGNIPQASNSNPRDTHAAAHLPDYQPLFKFQVRGFILEADEDDFGINLQISFNEVTMPLWRSDPTNLGSLPDLLLATGNVTNSSLLRECGLALRNIGDDFQRQRPPRAAHVSIPFKDLSIGGLGHQIKDFLSSITLGRLLKWTILLFASRLL